ncbi:MAG: hypothetical protein GXO74_04695 [Calditrichaeota bacterium]|nr:hypothetical protein [Calditrichota bacterium]
MNRHTTTFVTFLIISILVFFSPANSQVKLVPQITSPALGEVIDANENLTFQIFPNVRGFSAARFYLRDANDYYLHILRNSETGGQVLILHLNLFSFNKIKTKILKKIKQFKTTGKADQILVCPIEEAKWQETTKQKKIQLVDGNEIYGVITGVKNDTLLLQTNSGLKISIPDETVQSIQGVRTRVVSGGKFYRVDPNSSRLFFAPTGRALKKESGYFADYYIFFPTVAYGFSDNIACAVGMSIFPGASSQLIYVAPKITFPLSKSVGMSAGLLYMAIPEKTDDVGLGYVVSTFGDQYKGITLGVGVSMLSNNNGNAVLLVGGETQVSNRVKLISENWIFTGGDGFTLLSGGIRFFGDRMAVDLAFLTAKEFWEESEGFPFIPYVDFSVMFGK